MLLLGAASLSAQEPTAASDEVGRYCALLGQLETSYGSASTQLRELAAHDSIRTGSERIAAAAHAALARGRNRLWLAHALAYQLQLAGLTGEARDLLRDFAGSMSADREQELSPSGRAMWGSVLTALGQLCFACNDRDEALDACAHAASLLRAIQAPDSVARRSLANALATSGRVWLDRQHLSRAYRLLREAEQLDPVPAALGWAEYHLFLNDPEQALRKLHALTGVPGERAELARWLRTRPLEEVLVESSARTVRAELSADEKERQDTVDLLEQLLSDGFAPAMSAMVRARLYLDHARLVLLGASPDAAVVEHDLEQVRREVAPRSELTFEATALHARLLLARDASDPDDLRLFESSATALERATHDLLAMARRAPLFEGGVGFFGLRRRRAVPTEWIAMLARLDPGRARAAAEQLTWNLQSAGSFARESHLPAPSTAGVRADLLRGEHGIVTYLLGPNVSWIVAVGPATTTLLRAPGWNRICRVQDEADGPGVEGRAAAHELARQLLPDALLALMRSWRTTTVADLGVLNGLPLEGLPLGPGAAAPMLGEEIAINDAVDVPAALAWARDPARYHALPHDEVRARLVASIDAPELDGLLAPWLRPSVLLGEAATRTAVLGAGSRLAVLQVVAHGERHADRARPWGLRLQDGWLGAAQLAPGSAHGLVILSSCGVGRGQDRWGESRTYSTLGGAFLRAGAHTVVEAAVDLQRAPHLALMKRFHAGLARGDAPAEALRAARAAFRTAPLRQRWEHAHVRVFGLGHLPVVSAR